MSGLSGSKRIIPLKYALVLMVFLVLEAAVFELALIPAIREMLKDVPSAEQSQVFRTFMDMNHIFLPLAVLFTGSLAVYIYFYSHKISRPVVAFEEKAQRMAAGDLSVQVQLRRGDELRDLADLFNRMSANLADMVRVNKQLIRQSADMIDIMLHVDEITAGIDALGGTKSSEDYKNEKIKRIGSELSRMVDELRQLTAKYKTE